MYESGPFGEASGARCPSRWRPSTPLRQQQTGEGWPPTPTIRPGSTCSTGTVAPPGMFPGGAGGRLPTRDPQDPRRPVGTLAGRLAAAGVSRRPALAAVGNRRRIAVSHQRAGATRLPAAIGRWANSISGPPPRTTSRLSTYGQAHHHVPDVLDGRRHPRNRGAHWHEFTAVYRRCRVPTADKRIARSSAGGARVRGHRRSPGGPPAARRTPDGHRGCCSRHSPDESPATPTRWPRCARRCRR